MGKVIDKVLGSQKHDAESSNEVSTTDQVTKSW